MAVLGFDVQWGSQRPAVRGLCFVMREKREDQVWKWKRAHAHAVRKETLVAQMLQ